MNAGDEVLATYPRERRLTRNALLASAWATRREGALVRQHRKRRHATWDLLQATRPPARKRAEQADGVRVLRGGEELVHLRLLDLPARVHHHDAVGDVRDDAEVVRDEADRNHQQITQ